MSVSELEHPSTTSTAATEDALFQRLSEWLGQRVEAPLDLVCLEEAGLEPALIDRLIDAGFTRPDITWVIPTRTLAHRKQRNEPLGQGGLKAPGRWHQRYRWTRAQGDQWLAQRHSLLLEVPSGVAPQSWNTLLNPLHPQVALAAITAGFPYPLDQRLYR